MAQITVEDLDPWVVEKLEARAQRQGRSLAVELRAILTAAVEEREAEEQRQTVTAAVEGFRRLRQKLSLAGLSVQGLTEEGRRF